MTNLIGLPLEYVKQKLIEMGKDVLVKNNYNHINLSGATLLVTNASEVNGVVTLTVGEFFIGE